ncbi:MAG: ParB/RepB/Spo0J family partition protein [Candidatus Eiseniibacteriota bacterium]
MSKRGLGRGLGALIPETTALSHREGDVVLSLPIESIRPNPRQPRHDFPAEDIDPPADSIREQGLLQPVLVRRASGGVYELIAGERRWRAAARAGFEQIPAIVREASDEEMLPLALVENLVRADLNPIDEALAYRELADVFEWTQEEIARWVGRGRVNVANTLRLLNLPASLQEEVREGRLSRGHARALLACRDEQEMLKLHEQIRTQELTVREAEDRAATVPGFVAKGAKKRRRAAIRTTSPETRELEEKLQRVYGTPVQIHDRGGRGHVSLEFYSYDDLDRLIELLLAAEQRVPDHL